MHFYLYCYQNKKNIKENRKELKVKNMTTYSVGHFTNEPTEINRNFKEAIIKTRGIFYFEI